MQDKPANFLKSETDISKIRRPAFCRIGIPATCMLRCKMCFGWKINFRKDPEEPTLREWCNFIALLSDFSDNSIEMNFSDTEPLLDERNLALISFSAKKGLPTSMHTSGFLIDKEMASRIVDTGLHQITLSLDGFTKETHDYLRGAEGCYDKVMQAIGYLGSYGGGLKIGIQTIILAKNLDEIVSLVEWVNQDARVGHISFQAITQPFFTPLIREWYNKSEYAFLWPKNIKKVHAVIDELIRLKKIGYKIGNPVSQLETFKRYFERPDSFIRKANCNVDFWMNINQHGDVRMCENMERIGNIKSSRPEEIWHSQESIRRREGIRNCKANCHTLVNCAYEEEQ
jgi:MoaA/NifB/PqqE/SkfB family radical SAM enzyme